LQRELLDPTALDEERIRDECKPSHSFLVTQGHGLAISESAVRAVSGKTASIDPTALPYLDPDDVIAFAHTLSQAHQMSVESGGCALDFYRVSDALWFGREFTLHQHRAIGFRLICRSVLRG
jgi:hypothetical protein